jgi:hypothetical protein
LCARLFDVLVAQIKCTDQSDAIAPFQDTHARHRRSPPIGWRSPIILHIIQKLTAFYEPYIHAVEGPSKTKRLPFAFRFPSGRVMRKLTIAPEVFVFSYAFAILLSMMGIACEPAMDRRRRQAPSDQLGFSLR